MSDIIEKVAHVAICNIQFKLFGVSYNTNVLVSTHGAPIVFEGDEAPQNIDQVIGCPIPLLCDGVEIQGFFVKELSSHNPFYSIQFDADWAARKMLDEIILLKGAKMPPRRKFPRLDARADIQSPLPRYVLICDHQESIFYSVVNFTISGLLIESYGSVASHLDVGQYIKFDMHISDGQLISGLCGQAVRMKEATSDELLGEQCVQYGIRISHSDQANYENYRKIIFDYCMAVQDKAS